MASGFVYFLSAGKGLVKVGKTTRQPTARIAEYSPLLPFDTTLSHVIECADCGQTEKHIHQILEAQHVRGEWFRLSDDDIEAIRSGVLDRTGNLDY